MNLLIPNQTSFTYRVISIAEAPKINIIHVVTSKDTARTMLVNFLKKSIATMETVLARVDKKYPDMFKI